MRRVAVLVAGLAAACGPKTIDHPVVEDTKGLLPESLDAQRPRKGDPRPLVVRVWVDPVIRGDTGWKDRITEELDYANQYLGPLVGITLETASIHDWDKRPDLGSALEDLVETDPGDDAAWVIGYIAAPDAAMTAFNALGAGDALGRHVIIRGWAAGPETDALAPKMPALPQNEKAEVLGAHRRHKQAVILLHYLARTLGAIAEQDPAWIQHNAYSPKQTTFSERNRELVQLGVDARVTKASEGETAMMLLAAVEASEFGGWVPADKDDVVGRLRNVIDAAKAGETAADVPAAAYGQFDRARTLARRQQFDEALSELEPLIAAYPANATMRILVCDIELHRSGPGGDAAKKACGRAIELAAGDPRPHVTIAGAWMAKNDLAAARAELVLAEGKIANLPKPAQGWLELAEIYRAMGAVTWAEAAVAKAGAAEHPVLTWTKTTRARYGLPASGKGAVKPEDEAAAVAAVRQVLDAVYASKFADAARAVKTASKRFPGLPGVSAAWCDLDLRQDKVGSAKKRCAAAIAAQADASWALYLMGIIIMKDTGASDTADGIDHLKRAIAADPDLAQAWRALGKAYKRAKDLEALKQLEADYQARFGQALGD